MPGRPDRSISVEEVESEIAQGFRKLRFSDPVERLFFDQYLARRARMVPLWALLGTLMYALAALGDLSAVPDVATTMLWLRFGVFVPFAVAVVVSMRIWPSTALYDLLALAVGTVGICLPMVTMVFSQSDHLLVYQSGSIGTYAFFVIVLRPRFRTVLAGLAILTTVQLVTIHLNGGFDTVTYSGIVTFYVTLSVFLAMSAYFGEHVDRQNFLNWMRGEALQADLRKLSESDPMTGLYNRHSLNTLRGTIWSRTKPGSVISAIMLDIDNFKLYNDLYGHLDGDTCIRRVAHSVTKLVGEAGRVFRYGGEELLVLLPGSDRRSAFGLGERIRQSIEELAIPHTLSQAGVVTVSLGVSSSTTDRHTMEELLRSADAALYEAKRAGRNRVSAWAPDPDRNALGTGR